MNFYSDMNKTQQSIVIFSNYFILVRVSVDLEPIQATLGANWEYLLMEHQSITDPNTHIYTLFDT